MYGNRFKRGGGLYSSFVSASGGQQGGGSARRGRKTEEEQGDDRPMGPASRPIGGAAIPPPSTLTHNSTPRPGFAPIPSAPSSSQHPFAPPTSYSAAKQTSSRRSFDNPTPGVSKHGYSTIDDIDGKNVGGASYGLPVKRTRTEEDYFNDDEDEEEK